MPCSRFGPDPEGPTFGAGVPGPPLPLRFHSPAFMR